MNTTTEIQGFPAQVFPLPEGQMMMPPKDYLHKGQRYKLIFDGVCTHCAHCGLKLTDAVSIERGLGPICSRKGYMEEPMEGDAMQAFIDLAEYPELVEFLTTNYKPQGNRALMNGIVKICALNRRSPVHDACCDAVESLGYTALASALRESISVVEIKDSKDFPNCYEVWVKKAHFSWAYNASIRSIEGAFFSRPNRAWVIRVSKLVEEIDAQTVHPCAFEDAPNADGTRNWPAKVRVLSEVRDANGVRKVSNKKHLWDIMLKHYEGFCAKVPSGTGSKVVKIKASQKP